MCGSVAAVISERVGIQCPEDVPLLTVTVDAISWLHKLVTIADLSPLWHAGCPWKEFFSNLIIALKTVDFGGLVTPFLSICVSYNVCTQMLLRAVLIMLSLFRCWWLVNALSDILTLYLLSNDRL